MSEQKKWLYQALVDEGYDVGESYEEFDSLITNNKESREWVYNELSNREYNLGDRDEFDSLIGGNSNYSNNIANSEVKEPKAERPISAVQSPEGPFYTKDDLMQYKGENNAESPTASVLERPKAEINPISAVRKADGSEYSFGELQAISKQ